MDNWVFGMGGALLQQVNRDTLRFALKCSAIDVNGQWHDVYKQPVTDPGKDSRAGRFVVLKEGQEFVTVKVDANASSREGDPLETVLENGELRRHQPPIQTPPIPANHLTYKHYLLHSSALP